MPKNSVTDPITDQEIAFAHLILSGTMTDRRAAEAVGLNPDTAAYTKAKPRMQAYMHDHRAAMHKEAVQQEADLARRAAEQLQRKDLVRDQVLVRLWEIANLSHEVTRNSVTAQIKALSLIISIEGLIPDRRAASAEKKPASLPPDIYKAPWLIEREQRAAGTWLDPDPTQDEDEPAPPPIAEAEDATSDSTPEPHIDFGKSEITQPFSPAQSTPWEFQAPRSIRDEEDSYEKQMEALPRRRNGSKR